MSREPAPLSGYCKGTGWSSILSTSSSDGEVGKCDNSLCGIGTRPSISRKLQHPNFHVRQMTHPWHLEKTQCLLRLSVAIERKSEKSWRWQLINQTHSK